MGGLGPGIGGLEILVIGLVALLVVGPKDLPLMMRKVGKAMAKARAMANEFRASFDELARQSELDELRKEVEALRKGQGILPLGKEAEQAFGDIKSSLSQPLLPSAQTVPALPASEPVKDVAEFPDPVPAPADPVFAEMEAEAPPPKPRKRKATAKTSTAASSPRARPAAKGDAPRTKAPVKRTRNIDL